MKKFLSILLGVVLVAGAVLVTSSCKKDIENAKALTGTVWEAGDTESLYYLITFKDQTNFEMTYHSGGVDYLYKGVFIITGSKSGLTGCRITFTFDDEIWESSNLWKTGEFTTEDSFTMNNIVFTRFLDK